MGDRLDALITPEAGLVAQCRADVERWHDASHGSMLRLALGPSNLPYGKPQLLHDFARIADDTGCGLHAHYHPRQAERAECRAVLGCEPIEFLERAGWLRPGAWLAHCTELDDAEIDRFAATGTGVAHCPRTVLRLGYHVPRIARMRAAGTPLGVGVDGAASNDGGAFIADLRLALLLHRTREQAPLEGDQVWMAPEDALRLATSDAAALLGRDDIGRLKVGMCADITAFDLGSVGYGGSLNDPLAGFLLAGTETRATTTIVNGQCVVRDGKLVTADERVLARTTQAASAELLRRTAVRYQDAAS
jgi:cytosine/adenosine deaminase-related metal-dependent hydrolase